MLTPPEQNNPKSEDVPEKNLKRKASPVIEKLQLGRRIKKKFGPNYYYGTIEYVSDTFLSIIYDDGDDEAGYIHDNDLKLIQFVNSPEKKKKIIKYTEKTTKENPKCLFELQGLDKRNFEKKSLIPGISCSKQTFSVLEFYLFTYERQRMWERKTQNPLSTPYSRNERMSNYSFCNIYRELDRGTVYFKASILELFHKSRAWDMKEWTKQVLWRSYLYRLVNRVETFQNIDFAEPNKASLQKYIQRARAYWRKTSPFFTGAHNVSGFEPYISALSQSLNKLDATVDQFWSAPTSEDKLNVLLEMELVGDFFAWQIMCDMEMCGCLIIDYDFCILGPGAKNGLDLIFGTPNADLQGDNKKDKCLRLARKLTALQEEAFQILELEFPYFDGKRLALKEIEHTLCEYNKYKCSRAMHTYRPNEKPGFPLISFTLIDANETCK